MRSAGWCAYMQSQLEREVRQKEYERKRAERESWNSDAFEHFRDRMRSACPNCEKKELCMGGCPLMPEIVFCTSTKRKII